MATDEDFDDIPTLSDIVFPGNPEKIIANRSSQDGDTTLSDLREPEANLEKPTDSPNTYIQDEIDSIVESVLAKYFFKVRKEIVEEIMKELHKKIP